MFSYTLPPVLLSYIGIGVVMVVAKRMHCWSAESQHLGACGFISSATCHGRQAFRVTGSSLCAVWGWY